MSKKFVIGALTVLGLLAVSLTPAAATTCLSWKTIGGSSMCVAWATKGVQVAITFRDGCFITVSPEEGGGTFAVEGCEVTARAVSTDTPTSIAFCANAAGNVVKVACDQPFSFGPTLVGGQNNGDCVEHRDNESPQGEAHEQHKCVATATLPRNTSCDTCCGAPHTPVGFNTCVDLTPVEMETRLEAFYPGGGREVASCAPGSFDCTVQQTCSINPKKIALITDPSQGREYQCNVDCVGDACPSRCEFDPRSCD